MSVIKVNNITNRDGTSGPVIAGITTVSSTSHLVVPTGSTGQRVALAPDPYINNLVLALPFNSESVFTDASPKIYADPLTKQTGGSNNTTGIGTTTASLPFGQVGIATTAISGIVTHSKYYGTSLFMMNNWSAGVGVTSVLRYGNSTVANDFIVDAPISGECWVYHTITTGQQLIIGKESTWWLGNGAISINGISGKFGISLYDSSLWYTVNSNDTTVANRWYHLAFSWDGNILALFVDGVLKAKQEFANGKTWALTQAATLDVGTWSGNTSAFGFNGYLQDFRFYKGIAKYKAVGIATETTVFTPPNQIAL